MSPILVAICLTAQPGAADEECIYFREVNPIDPVSRLRDVGPRDGRGAGM